MKRLLLPAIFAASIASFAQRVPSFEEVISLRAINGVVISPDGRHVLMLQQSTDWNENRNDTEIWLSKDGNAPFQLTFNPKNSSMSPAFSPDGQWIAFLSDRGNKNQVYVMRTDGGEARAVTKEDEGVSSFEWHPAGNGFIILKPEKEDKNKKDREKRYGGFEADDEEFTLSHLWQVDFRPDLRDVSEYPC